MEALETTPRMIKKAASSSSSSTNSVSVDSTASSSWSQRRDTRTGPFEGVAETLYGIRNGARVMSPKKLREGIETVTSEVENVVSR